MQTKFLLELEPVIGYFDYLCQIHRMDRCGYSGYDVVFHEVNCLVFGEDYQDLTQAPLDTIFHESQIPLPMRSQIQQGIKQRITDLLTNYIDLNNLQWYHFNLHQFSPTAIAFSWVTEEDY